jgi:hypothetical protein
MADKFTTADERNLLSQPGYFYSRAYGSTGGWDKSVFMNGSTYQANTDSVEIAFEDVGTVRNEVSDETVEISISAGQVLDLSLISRLSGGLFSYETVSGTPVVGATQTLESGDWSYQRTALIENQNGDGSVISITSVTGSVDGALVEDTDYFITKLDGAGWAVVLIDSSTITTETQDMVIVYDYTPSAQTILKRGGVKIIDPIELAFQTIAKSQADGTDEYVTYYFYKCFSNGNIGHGFSPENEATPITMDLGFTAKKDINRTSGDQLYKVVRGDTYLG